MRRHSTARLLVLVALAWLAGAQPRDYAGVEDYGDLVYDYGYGDYGENTPYNPFFYYDYVDSERVDEEVSLPADTVQLCHTTDGVTYYNGTYCDLQVSGTARLVGYPGTMDGRYVLEGCHHSRPMYKRATARNDTLFQDEHLHIMYHETFRDWGVYDTRGFESEDAPLLYGGTDSALTPDLVPPRSWVADAQYTDAPPADDGSRSYFVPLEEFSVACGDQRHEELPEPVRMAQQPLPAAPHPSVWAPLVSHDNTPMDAPPYATQQSDHYHHHHHHGPLVLGAAVVALAVAGVAVATLLRRRAVCGGGDGAGMGAYASVSMDEVMLMPCTSTSDVQAL